MRGAATFDPAASTHRFRLMMTDLGLMALFPYIIRAVLAAAPNVGIDVIPLDTAQLHDRLVRNEVDAAIGIPAMHEDDLLIEPLMDMPYVRISALEHPRLSASPSLQDLGAEKHFVASKALGHEHVLQRLREVGVGDTVAITLPSFAVGSQTLAVTDYVVVVPKALAHIAESQGNIRPVHASLQYQAWACHALHLSAHSAVPACRMAPFHYRRRTGRLSVPKLRQWGSAGGICVRS